MHAIARTLNTVAKRLSRNEQDARPGFWHRRRTWAGGVAGLALLMIAPILYLRVPVHADPQTATSCANLIVPQHLVQGHLVGETDCQITDQSAVTNNKGQKFDEVSIALSGTAFGYVDPNTKGNTRRDITDAPNILFPQFGITSWVPAVGQYSGTASGNNAGAGLTVLYPDPSSGTPWNGKVFVAVHGQANNEPIGPLAPQNGDNFAPNTFDNLYADEMIDKGYAVVYTRRPASSGVPATLESGTVLDESLNDNVDTIVSFAKTGEKLIQDKLGKAPTATYWYGHSAGVILGRLVNYSGLNFTYGSNGKPFFAGFLEDDAGGGLPQPLSMPEGSVLGEQGNLATFNKNDELFQTSQARATFTKEINFSHDMYEPVHSWLPQLTYLDLKRQNAQLIQQEGLGDKSRTYEIAGVSHIAATSSSPARTLDIGGMADAAIDLLDNWVQHNVAPPKSIVNLASLSTNAPITSSADPSPMPDNNMHNAKTSVELPPIACPTGVRSAAPAPDGAASSTGYTPYDGTSLEPVNAGGALVDVNGNGFRDTMPTMQEAWQMLGLLKKHQTLDKSAYVACVTKDVSALTHEHLLSQTAANFYLQTAQQFPNLPW